jgi:hypothetical protein
MSKEFNWTGFKTLELLLWGFFVISVLPNNYFWNILLSANKLGLNQAWGFGVITILFTIFMTKLPISLALWEIINKKKEVILK